MESHSLPGPTAFQENPDLLGRSWPSDLETAEPAEVAPARGQIAIPVALAVGAFGLALLGISQLLKRRQGHGKTSFVADALRSVSLSVLGVIASRMTERLATPPLLGQGTEP